VSPDFRKAALIAATLGLIVSLFFALRPDDEEDAASTTPGPTVAATTETQATEPEPEPAPEPEPEPTTAAAPPPDATVTIRLAVSADTAPTVRKYSVRRGREVAVVVRSELADHVHVHGYDLMADVAPGQPARIEFTADAPGLFEIELEDRHLLIANLEVRP
jgi:hypothetical protein